MKDQPHSRGTVAQQQQQHTLHLVSKQLAITCYACLPVGEQLCNLHNAVYLRSLHCSVSVVSVSQGLTAVPCGG